MIGKLPASGRRQAPQSKSSTHPKRTNSSRI
jgi:hypothetical protein